MAVSSRKVQNKRDSNGVLTGKAGTVYDVNIKYTGQDGKKKSYAKKGFATKKEATQHEAEMKAKLANPIYSPVVASQGKQTVKEYLEEWKKTTARLTCVQAPLRAIRAIFAIILCHISVMCSLTN